MYHVSNQQTSTADYLIIALPCSFSTLEAAIQKWEDHPFGSRNKLNSLIFMIRGEKNTCSSGERTRVPLPLQHSILEPRAHVTMLALITWLWPRTCQKSYWSSWYLGKVLLNLQPSELFIFSSSTKWNHHRAIYLDHISSAAHRNLSWVEIHYYTLRSYWVYIENITF